MPKLVSRTARMCYLPSRKCAVVYLNGKRIILGPWPEYPKPPAPGIRAKYHAAVLSHSTAPGKTPSPKFLTMAMVIDKITDWALEYYAGDARELHAVTVAAGVLLSVTGDELAVDDLGPTHIVRCREVLASNRTRQGANKVLGMVKRLIRRGCELGVVPPAVLAGCVVVTGLRPGRTSAPESNRRGAVADEAIEATIGHLTPQLTAMVRLQRLTGMRPGELCGMTWAQIDTTGPVWMYRPIHHKTAHRGKIREIPLGNKAQSILNQWRSLDGGAVFSPRRDHPELRHDWKRAPGNAWAVSSYCHAIGRACAKANVPRWSPQDLRKAKAQEIRDTYGLEASADLLGHSVEVNSRHYSKPSKARSMEIVAISG